MECGMHGQKILNVSQIRIHIVNQKIQKTVGTMSIRQYVHMMRQF